METTICGMTLKEIEKKFEKYEKKRARDDLLDRTMLIEVISDITDVGEPDDIPNGEYKLARKIGDEISAARDDLANEIVKTGDKKKRKKLFSRYFELFLLAERCKSLRDRHSHYTL